MCEREREYANTDDINTDNADHAMMLEGIDGLVYMDNLCLDL